MTTAMHRVANQSAGQTIAGAVAVRGNVRRMAATARHGLTVLGVFAIATLVMMFFKPELADRLQALSPFSPAVAAISPDSLQLGGLSENAVTATAVPAVGSDTDKVTVITRSAAPSTDLQQQRVTQWLSKRYRVANDATNMLVSAAYSNHVLIRSPKAPSARRA
jgi:hypothetical protein